MTSAADVAKTGREKLLIRMQIPPLSPSQIGQSKNCRGSFSLPASNFAIFTSIGEHSSFGKQ